MNKNMLSSNVNNIRTQTFYRFWQSNFKYSIADTKLKESFPFDKFSWIALQSLSSTKYNDRVVFQIDQHCL